MTRLTDKCAIITGAARGIGMAFAQAYVSEGAKVAIADIDYHRAKSTAAQFGQAATAVEIDVADHQSINLAVEKTVKLLSNSNFG